MNIVIKSGPHFRFKIFIPFTTLKLKLKAHRPFMNPSIVQCMR